MLVPAASLEPRPPAGAADVPRDASARSPHLRAGEEDVDTGTRAAAAGAARAAPSVGGAARRQERPGA